GADVRLSAIAPESTARSRFGLYPFTAPAAMVVARRLLCLHRMRSASTIAVLCLVISAAIGACGRGSSDRGGEQADQRCQKLGGEPQREACEKAEAAGRIPAADRASYYALATSAGLLRANAV